MMSDQRTTEQFIGALAALERDRDLESITAMFGPACEIGNLITSRHFSGPQGAREFWKAYRATFGEVESEFRNVVVGNGSAALEWTTSGTSVQGEPIMYSGVSILEYTEGRISRFWAYFDPGALGRQIEHGGTPRR